MYRQVLKLGRLTHSKTRLSYFNLMLALAENHDAQGQHREAEAIVQEVLPKLRETWGSRHPKTFWAQQCLGQVLNHQEKYVEAENLLREAWEGQKGLLGSDHPSTLSTQRCLAECLRD